MSIFKRVSVFFLSLLPIKAISYAAEYNSNVEYPILDSQQIKEEFLGKLDNMLLHQKYYDFMAKKNINNTTELLHIKNVTALNSAVKQYAKDKINSKHYSAYASSTVTD